MAKKSQKRSVRYEKDQLGCMWGLMSIFDFRHGRPTWKLISDKRHGSKQAVATGLSRNKFEVLSTLDENFEGTLDGDGSSKAIVLVDACKPSVKKLMEEEMSSEQGMKKEISNHAVETKQSESSQNRRDQKKTKRTRKKSRDMDTHIMNASENSESGCSCNQNPEQKTRSNVGMDEIMEEVCCQIHQKYINCANHDVNGEAPVEPSDKHSDFEEKLCVAIKEFMNHKLADGKHLTEDQKVHHFKELMDALEVLSSDEELFLKLLQDPNSLLAKHVQKFQDAQIEKDEEYASFAESKLSEQKLGDVKQSEELVNRKQRYFFRRKVKPQERNPSKENEDSEASKRIVILKPGHPVLRNSETGDSASPESHNIVRNKGPSERVGSHFFLSEIKRKLKNAMGKQHHGASTVGSSNRLPYGRQNSGGSDKGIGKEKLRSSPGKEHFYIERIAKPSGGIKRAEKTGKVKEPEVSLKHENHGLADERLSNLYIEAKKHLCEMLSNGDEGVDISRQQFPKSLGKILSLPEYNVSPFGSPGRDLEHGFVTAQMRLSAYDKLLKANENTLSPKQEKNASPLGEVVHNLGSLPSNSDNNPDDKVQPSNSIPSISDNLIQDNEVEEAHPSVVDKKNSEGVEIKNGKEIVAWEEEIIAWEEEIVAWEEEIVLDALSELSGSSIAINDQNDDKRISECLQQNSYDENPQSSSLASPSSSLTTKHVEDLESGIDTPERPSPVSVLEPLFTEDDISPGKTISRFGELQPLRIEFEDYDPSAAEQANNAKTCTEDKELMFDFVKAVMQASVFNWDDFCMKWLSSDQIIEPSLCDEVEFFPNQLCYDSKLLVDCINEVLLEVCGRYYGCFPRISSAKPSIRPVPDMKTAIDEVWIEVYWHLRPLPLPRTLDQIVTKDMSRPGTWMDLRFDAETIGVDMGEAILQELMEDTILSYVEGSLGSEDVSVKSESNETESNASFIAESNETESILNL
ncbi:hypothetical protein EV1_000649 [Malus domestica]